MPFYSILVVDDEPDLRELVQITLELAGHKVVVAENGRKASDALLLQKFDLVITDVLMPECDGIEVIGEVRKKYPETRIVVMTAGGQVPRGDYLLIAKRLGANVAVEKPFTGRQMLDAVGAAMGV